MKDALELLYTADLHLGRHPSRIPDDLDGPQLSPKAVWLSTVEEAIDRDVDAVVVAGDVVDQENRYFEAFGAFEDGVAQLDEQGIPTVVVAGNHDFDALPELVDNLDIEGLQLLGRGEQWERWTLERGGDPVAHFDGWSFSTPHVYESPLAAYDQPPVDGVPQIGVLHADLDTRGSQYAPVQSSELRETAADVWLLGHVHSPGIELDTSPLAMYSGTPQPLDPGEPKAHGPWLVTMPPAGTVQVEQLPLASVRYDRVTADVTDAETPQEATARISEAIDEHVRAELDTSSLELSLVRVRLTGRTPAHSALVEQHRSMERDLGFREGSVSVRIESIAVDTRPAVDLEALADGDTAAAYLADLLLEIESGDPHDSHGDLVDDARSSMKRAYGANAYTQLRRETERENPTGDDALAELERQARLLLDALVGQKEEQA